MAGKQQKLSKHGLAMGVQAEQFDDLAALFILNGDIDRLLQLLLNNGLSVNARLNGLEGLTLLHYYATTGHTQMVLRLLHLGAEKAVSIDPLGTPLHLAASCGHASTLKVLLKAGCPVDVVTSDGTRVLHAAAKGGNAEMIREILSMGCDINAADNNGQTPLHVAAGNGNTEAAVELIKRGAKKVTVVGPDRALTPLHLAVLCGHVSTVKALLKAGCPVDAVESRHGYSVLHAAAKGGNAKVIREVLSTGCDINAANNLGETPLHVAACNGKADAALELIRLGAKKTVVIGVKGTPLHLAAAFGHVSTVKAMLKAGCPVDVVASNGKSVLHLAVGRGNIEVIRELLSARCDINATDNEGVTPLHVAAITGNTEAALELISRGANKSIIAASRIHTPLFQAAMLDHLSTMKAMLKAGCPVGSVDFDGRSVLHYAAEDDKVGIIREVLSTGCECNITDNKGVTPLHVAAANGNTKAALEFIKHGAVKAIVAGTHGTPLHQAAGHGHVSTLLAMLKAGCPVDVVDSKAGSILHAAAEGGNARIVQEALRKGCDINGILKDGRTPLHLASWMGHTEAVLELIRHGADMTIVAGTIGTPLLGAIMHGHVPTIKAMVKAGCPVDAVTGDGKSILHYATSCDNAEVIKAILRAGCDINVTDNEGATPLHTAAVNGWTEAALELIRLGAEKAIAGAECGTPLHQAAMRGHVSTMKAMLKAGCPVGVVDSNGRSVLHFAAAGGDIPVIVELMHHGFNVNGTDNQGQTPLDYAAQAGNEKVLLKLVGYGADITSIGGTLGGPVLAAARRGHWSTVLVLMEKGFPVDGVATDGMTLLHFVAMEGNVTLLHQLADRGFSVSRRDYFGLTPLHYAVLDLNYECMVALTGLGASAKLEAPLLGTALDILTLYGVGQSRKPGEMVVDFALCKELGIKIQSQYLFSEQGSRISVFEFSLFAIERLKSKVHMPKNLRKVISILSHHQLIDLSKLACLAAIHGDVEVLECLSEILTSPTEPGHFYCRLKQLFPTQFKHDSTLKVLPECALNPLQLAIIAMMCMEDLSFHHYCMEQSSRNYIEVINFLTSSDLFQYTLNEFLPNGLSPLDLAEKLGLDKAVNIISRAGGRQGILSNIPEEVRLQHGPAVLHLHQGIVELTSFGTLGKQAVQAVLSQLMGRTTTAEQGTATEESHLCQQKTLEQRPDLSIISTFVIGLVNVDRWRRLGISLKISLEALSHISSAHSSSEDRYLEVLIYWLEHNEAASWRTLLEVLGHFETKLIMDLLTQKICGTENCSGQSTSVRRRVPFHPYPPEVGPTPPPPTFQLSSQLISHVVRHVGVKWYNFALHLGISSTVLDVIKVEIHLISDCCRESLHRWLRCDPDTGGERREVGVVLEAVRKACGPVAVERIQSSLQSSRVTPSSPTPLLQSTPELAALQEHAVPFTAAQWEAVADYLLVSYEKQAAIAASERGCVEVCCRELFNQWLQQLPGTGSLPRTWGAVLDVVGEAVGPEVAKQIRTRLDSKEGATPTYSPLADPLRDALLSSKPTAVPLLKKVVPSVAHKWHQLGVHLGMEAAVLKTFKVTESHDVKLCCLEMFECWLEGSRGTGESPRTWSTVLSAVGDCLGRDVADNIERALLEERRQRK